LFLRLHEPINNEVVRRKKRGQRRFDEFIFLKYRKDKNWKYRQCVARLGKHEVCEG
jgi:hypothetical protein